MVSLMQQVFRHQARLKYVPDAIIIETLSISYSISLIQAVSYTYYYYQGFWG